MSAPPATTRVLLADDHPLVREGIRSCLARADGIEVVGEASNGQEAIDLAKALSPDIVLMDINMPDVNGLQATERLQKEAPAVKVLVLTVHDNKEYVSRIVQCGARGYVLKDSAPDELLRAISAVESGEVFFSSRVAKLMIDDYVGRATSPEPAQSVKLTGRERQVLALIAEGLSNKDMARALNLGVRTVETHRERIMRKLNIRTTAGLTRYAIENQITFPQS